MTYLKRQLLQVHRTYSYFVTLICSSLLLWGAALSGAAAQETQRPLDKFSSDNGEIAVRQVQQMSVVIEAPAGVIYTDPTGGKVRYNGHPSPDIILISHEHHEHFDADTLEVLAGANTRIVVPPYVMERLPRSLRSRAVSLGNGETSEFGSIKVEAVPAYGINGESRRWHPQGRGNGYVVTVDGRRIYIAGSTDATTEMLQLRDIHIAFLPLYPPYALGVDDAVHAVANFKPEFAYIYQYNNVQTRNEFVRKMKSTSTATTVIARDISS